LNHNHHESTRNPNPNLPSPVSRNLRGAYFKLAFSKVIQSKLTPKQPKKMNDTTLAVAPQNQIIERKQDFSLSSMPVSQLLGQLAVVQEAMRLAMKENEHYGKIPGCGDKPALLKSGAEKLAFLFRMAPSFLIDERQLDRGHREYRVTCTMRQIGSGIVLGEGVGSASTMEGKWRFRTGPQKITDRPVPKDYWNIRNENPPAAQALIGKGNAAKKGQDGLWYIAEGGGEKIEHDNPADYYNTILKMAKKRAQVDATLTCTAASDCFTQDLDDINDASELLETQILEKEAKKPNFDKKSSSDGQETSPQPQKQAPARQERPSQPAAAPTAQDHDVWNLTLMDVTEKSGVTQAGKSWTLYTLDFADGKRATTFDGKLADEAVDNISGTVSAMVKPGKKQGQWDFVGFAKSEQGTSEQRDENGGFIF
jgi:hypothetical protein